MGSVLFLFGDGDSDPDEGKPLSYAQLLENSPDGHVLLDADERIIDGNAAARQMLAPTDLSKGVRLPDVLPELSSLLAETDHATEEIELGDGADSRYLEVRYVPLSAAEQETTQLLTVRDITERRRIEKQYRELIENASDLVVVLDETGTITFAGPSFERMLGYDPEELVGADVFGTVHPDDEESLREEFEQLLDEPEDTRRFEYRVRTDGGEWRILEGIGRNLLENSIVQGVVVNSRDVTERKQREYDLQRENERLEEFANIVSHDLRSPLQVAMGHLDQAKQTGEEAAFQKVESAHDRIETIIEDVLTLAKQGQTVGETETTELEEIAREAWETVETREMELVVESCQIEADRDRLRQLFENLFRNALEHAGPETTVSVGPIEPMQTSTRATQATTSGFYVEDDGPGISEENREKVFESGFTTDSEGTGFGLAIVEQIAEAHRWEPRVTAGRNGGARFEFTETLPDRHLRPD